MSENFDNLQMFYKKLDPTVAGLIGAGLGWLVSDTLVDTPRGRWTPQQEREWERVVEQAAQRSRDRKLLSLLRRKNVDIEKNLMPGGKKVGYIPIKTGSKYSKRGQWQNPEASAASKPTKRIRRDAPVEPETTPDKMRPTMRTIVGNRRNDSKFPLIMSLAYTSQNIKKALFSGSAKPAKGRATTKPKLMSLLARKPSRKKIVREMNRRDNERWSTGYGNMQADQDIEKDHMSVPPRAGLVFDPAKKRWTNPDNVGKTVTEVQGRKRIRGTGTGAHETALATGKTGGKGEGSAVAGRKFRDPTDIEEQEPAKKKPKKEKASALERFKEGKKEEDKKETKKRVEARRN